MGRVASHILYTSGHCASWRTYCQQKGSAFFQLASHAKNTAPFPPPVIRGCYMFALKVPVIDLAQTCRVLCCAHPGRVIRACTNNVHVRSKVQSASMALWCCSALKLTQDFLLAVWMVKLICIPCVATALLASRCGAGASTALVL